MAGMALGVLLLEAIFSDSIPHHVSINNSDLAVITDAKELAPEFSGAFLLGTAISVIAIVFMWHTRARPNRSDEILSSKVKSTLNR